jgi:hypothetical protein
VLALPSGQLIFRYSVLRQVHSFFQNDFSTECNLKLPLAIFAILSFPWSHQVVAYIFFLFFPLLLPSIFPPITCCRSKFLHKMWPVQLAFLLFILHTVFLSSLTLLHSTHDRSNWYSPSFSSTTFQNCPGISDLRSKYRIFSNIQIYALIVTRH